MSYEKLSNSEKENFIRECIKIILDRFDRKFVEGKSRKFSHKELEDWVSNTSVSTNHFGALLAEVTAEMRQNKAYNFYPEVWLGEMPKFDVVFIEKQNQA